MYNVVYLVWCLCFQNIQPTGPIQYVAVDKYLGIMYMGLIICYAPNINPKNEYYQNNIKNLRPCLKSFCGHAICRPNRKFYFFDNYVDDQALHIY